MTLRHGLYVSGASAGVTAPQDARLALAGLLTPNAGVVTGGAVTGSTSGPNMKYTIAAGTFLCARGTISADGVYLTPNDGAYTVDSGSPAPSSGTRWDLVWVRHQNAYGSDGFGDANSDPVFGVTVGTAGSSPTKPYSSVPAGALVLAESNVGTNIANASLATISNVAVSSGVVPPRAASSTFYPTSPAVGTIVDDAALGGLVRWNGTAWLPIAGGPLFVGTQATAQSLASGAWGWLDIDTTAVDNYSGHSNTTNNYQYVAPISGWYRITVRVGMSTAATVRGVAVTIGSSTPIGTTEVQTYTATAGYVAILQTTTVQYLTAGQWCAGMSYQNTGSAASTTAGTSELTVQWMHA